MGFFLCYVIAFVKNPGHHRRARISFFFLLQKEKWEESIHQ